MANVDSSIGVLLTADTRSLEAGLDRGSRKVRGFGRDAQTSARSFETSMQQLATSVVGKTTAVIAAVGAVTAAVRQSARAVATIGDQARRSGLGVEEFQELKFAAEQSRIPVENLVDGMKELSLRADEFITTGAGPAAEAFNRLGLSAQELRDGLEDPQELLLQIMDTLEGLDKAAQIRIADEVFGGTGGERFVELLGRGDDGLRQLITRSHEVGAVFSSEMIEKADDIDRRFSELTTRVENMGKRAVLSLADVVKSAIEGIQSIGDSYSSDAARRVETDLEGVKMAVIQLDHAMSNETMDLFRAIGAEGTNAFQQIVIEARKLSNEFQLGNIEADEFRSKMEDVAARAVDALAAIEDVNAANLSGIAGAVAGLSGLLAQAAANARDLAASIPEVGMDTGTPLTTAELPPSNVPVNTPTSVTVRPRAAPANIDFGVPVVSGGGGGGGGSGPTTEDFERLQEQFATEAELLQSHFEESLDLLEQYRAAKLATDEEFNELERRIMQDHADALKEIEQEAYQRRIGEVSDFFGALENVAQQGGDKMLRVTKAFGAAQALIDAWGAYAKVLNSPEPIGIFGRLAAAANVLAAGIGAVNAIKGVSVGGGGAGAMAGAAAAAAPPEKFVNVNVSGNIAMSGPALIEQINSLLADGYTLKGIQTT